MDSKTKKLIRETIYADKVIISGNGDVKVQQTFFYRHGMTPEGVGARAVRDLNSAGLTADVSKDYSKTFEHWAPWPKRSYMQATLENIREFKR